MPSKCAPPFKPLPVNENKETIVTKAYDLLKYAIPLINRLPKNQRYSYGDRLQNYLTDLLELLISAYYAPKNEKAAYLAKVNLLLEILRHYTRLGFDTGLYNSTVFQKLALSLLEIGKMNGAWLKSLKQ